jgi:hypothetical protein
MIKASATRRNGSHLELLTMNSVYFTPCHCEAQVEVHSKSIRLGTTESPKQSHGSDFATNSERFEVENPQALYNKRLIGFSTSKDCFVASHDCIPTFSWQSAANTNSFQTHPKNVSRNDKPQRKFRFVSKQSRESEFAHVIPDGGD